MALSDNQGSKDLELLSAYIDDELNYMQRTALEARLARDPALRRQLDELRLVVEAVQNLPPMRAPRDFTLTPEMLTDDVALQQKVATFLLFPTNPVVSALSAAAAVFLIGFGFMILFFSGMSGSAPSMAPADSGSVFSEPQSAPANVAAAPTDTPPSVFAGTVLPMMTVQVQSSSTPLPSPTAQPTLDAVADEAFSAEDDMAGVNIFEEAAESEERVEEQPPTSLTQTNTLDNLAVTEEALLQAETQEADSSAARAFASQTVQAPAPESLNLGDTDAEITAGDSPLASPTGTPFPITSTAGGSGGNGVTIRPTGTVFAAVLPTVAARPTRTPAPPPAFSDSPLSGVNGTLIVSFVAIGLGVLLFVVSIGTSITRRRNRRGRS